MGEILIRRATLNDLFEGGDDPITEVISIMKETRPGTLSQRVQEWLRQDERNVYIGRGTPWGNPASHQSNSSAEFKVETRDEAIEFYEQYLDSRPDLLSRLGELWGKRLGCWCTPKRCHGDILLVRVYRWHGCHAEA